MNQQLRFLVMSVLLLSLSITQVMAAPYYYIAGSANASYNTTHTLDVYLVTDSSTVTAAQTTIGFDNTDLTAKSISIIGSECTFWAPADPSLGYGNTPAPYFYPTSSSNKVVLSCGFANPGYTSSDSDGDLIAKIRFTPIDLGSTTISFNASNTLFRYIGSALSVGTLADFDLTVSGSTDSSTPTASASATATPTATATSSSSTSSDSDITVVNPTLYDDSILNFVEIGTNNSTTTTIGDDVTLQVIEEDNAIPIAPALDPRAPATPFIFKLFNGGEAGSEAGLNQAGEVLAAQSLRELLIPGRTNADKTVVMINLISTITFLVLLAVVIWRLVTITRMNRLKSTHMKDLLTSELSVLQSKLGNSDDETTQQVKQEIDDAVKRISEEK